MGAAPGPPGLKPAASEAAQKRFAPSFFFRNLARLGTLPIKRRGRKDKRNGMTEKNPRRPDAGAENRAGAALEAAAERKIEGEKPHASPVDVERMVEVIIDALGDVRAKDIVVIDTSEKTPLFSKIVVATGDSSRQVKSAAGIIERKLRENGFDVLGTEGRQTGEWALVDSYDVMSHIMLPHIREYYDLESLWGNGRR